MDIKCESKIGDVPFSTSHDQHLQILEVSIAEISAMSYL